MTTSINENGSLTARVAKNFRENVETRKWPMGQLVPSEEKLVEVYGVSRRTVRNALALLEAEGLLRAQQGRGRVVSENPVGSRLIVILSNVSRAESSHRPSGHDDSVVTDLCQAVDAAGRHVVLVNPQRLTAQVEIDHLCNLQPMGVIATHAVCTSEEGVRALHHMADKGIQIVGYGDGPGMERFDRIISDHARGGYLVARWLMNRGCRRILRLWSWQAQTYWVLDRERGIEQALKESGLPVLPTVRMPKITTRSDIPDAENADVRRREIAGFIMDRLQGPEAIDGVIVFNDFDAFPTAGAIELCGKKPGIEIPIAGYDNTYSHCWEYAPGVPVPSVTVDKHLPGLGERLVKLLLDRVEGRMPPEPQRMLDEPRLAVPGATSDE